MSVGLKIFRRVAWRAHAWCVDFASLGLLSRDQSFKYGEIREILLLYGIRLEVVYRRHRVGFHEEKASCPQDM